ncbi:MAG: DUF3786 domain-containing protein [Sedimentisphaerales bacterium]
MANEGLWQQLLKLDGQKTAQRAKCRYLLNPERYFIPLLNSEYIVNLPEKKAVSAEGSSETGFTEELCILTYLINSQDLPVANKLTMAQSLSGGQFFFRGLHKLAVENLEEVFGQCPERLYEVMDEFGARRCEFGDACIQLYVLPRIPLTIVIWRGDEEFGARASILFDETAAAQLPLDALWAAANFTIKSLVTAATKSS